MGAIEVFQAQGVDIDTQVTTYEVEVQIRNLLVGGVPSNPSVIRGWLKARLELKDQALEELVQETLKERGIATFDTTDEAIDVLMASEDSVSVNGFKRHPETGELSLEGRCVKSMLKEAMNSAFPGTEWPGKEKVSKGFRKGLMSTAAERVFVPEIYVGLGVKPDELSAEPGVGVAWVEERVKHVSTPQGPKSAISRVEVVQRPKLSFRVKVHDDFLDLDAWARIWERGEDIGLGSDRGRSDGSFDLVRFDKVS